MSPTAIWGRFCRLTLLAIQASLFASAVAAIIFATAVGLFAPGDGGGDFSGIVAFAGFVVGVLFGTPMLIVFGIPPVWLLERLLRAQPRLAFIVGTATGAVAGAIYLRVTATEYTFQPGTGVFTSFTVPTILFSASHGYFWVWMLKRLPSPSFEPLRAETPHA